MRRAALCVFFVLCLVVLARAQYRFDSWTTDNGLPQNSVYSIAQTNDGYLWFTTLDGLVRFDGVKFTVFNTANSKNLPNNRFIYVFAESNGALWFSTEDDGLIRRRNGEFKPFTMADGLPSNRIQEIQTDVDGSLLISSSFGLAL
jgi:ligand-binding sensor domain-containing protein